MDWSNSEAPLPSVADATFPNIMCNMKSKRVKRVKRVCHFCIALILNNVDEMWYDMPQLN